MHECGAAESAKTSKGEAVAALKASIDYCDSVYDGLTNATAAEPIKLFNGMRSRLKHAVLHHHS